ncbi:MAG: hypothetical protein ABI723_01510 [Bacteroidia bacterium]
MIVTIERQKLDSVMNAIRAVSFSEKQEEKTEEEVINSYLDSINDFKNELGNKNKKINEISDGIEALTWLQNKDQEILSQLNELIVLAKDVHATLIRKYISFNNFRQSGIAKNEITEFKQAIDFFKESYSDLECAFFTFPKNNDFVTATKDFEKE